MPMGMLGNAVGPAVGVGVLEVDSIDSDFDVGVGTYLLLVSGANPQPKAVATGICARQGKVEEESGRTVAQVQAAVVLAKKYAQCGVYFFVF